MADARQVSRQEQILKNKQAQLERLDKAREMMMKQIEREAEILEQMLGTQSKILDEMNSYGTQPPNVGDVPVSFKSQYDQFGNDKNVKYPPPGGGSDSFDILINNFTDKNADKTSTSLKTPAIDDATQPIRQSSDRSEHWDSLTENPNVPVYVSGRYVATEHGSYAINSSNDYEYELSMTALPINVGDIIRVPVHPSGHGDGKAFKTGYLQMQVDDIYTNQKFGLYHDRIE